MRQRETILAGIIFIILALGGALFCSLAGCAESAQVVQLKAQVASAKAEVVQTKLNAATREADIEANPEKHPIAITGVTLEKFRAPLWIIIGLSFLALLGSIGIWFTEFSKISKISLPISAVFFIGSLAGLFALPFALWIGGLAALCGVGLGIYEIVENLKKHTTATAAKTISALAPQASPTSPSG